MKRFATKPFIALLCTAGTLGLSTQAMASAFQLWEQDGASIGDYHAGYAAWANDASIGFYNPAGLTRFQNQQVVFGGDAIMSNFKYRGSLNVMTPFNSFDGGTEFDSIVAQGGQFGFVPSLHYVSPINDWMGFGFNVDVPFGLETNYGMSTPLKYAGTLSSITVVDISPSIGFKVSQKASLGVGFDIQRAFAEFNQVGTTGIGTDFDTTSTNKANDTGYGFHLGALYECTEDSRVGLSYHSQVVHHLTGSSHFFGPLADLDTVAPDASLISHFSKANLTLPPYTALSAYHKINPQVAIMGSAIYTQWSTFQTLILQNVAGVQDGTNSTSINVIVPEHYKNTWNFSVGSEYYVTPDVTLRGGLGYDQTPVSDTYRNIQLPDNNRFAVAIGGHYQACKAVGFDLGYTHFFMSKATVSPPPQVTGDQTVTTNGSVSGGADVIGGQVTWDIA